MRAPRDVPRIVPAVTMALAAVVDFIAAQRLPCHIHDRVGITVVPAGAAAVFDRLAVLDVQGVDCGHGLWSEFGAQQFGELGRKGQYLRQRAAADNLRIRQRREEFGAAHGITFPSQRMRTRTISAMTATPRAL